MPSKKPTAKKPVKKPTKKVVKKTAPKKVVSKVVKLPSSSIQKVAVIGAGVMGAGIAAQVANAGIPVLLLDIVPKGATDKNVIAKSAVQKLIKSNPAALMHKNNAKLIEVGNTEQDLKKLKECDWVVEAVIERLDIKQDLYKKIEKNRKAGAIVSSNTSTIPLEDLTAKMSADMAANFCITHFFNPPRYMRLLEIVTGPKTKAAAVKRVTDFCDYQLGKSIVTCNDTPGFIANRIGTYWLQAATVKAIKQKIDVESADALLSRPIGVPKTGVFGLLDLVGLDLMPHILESMENTLPKGDAFLALGGAPKLLQKMIKSGYTGRKGKGGFYALDDKKNKQVKDLQKDGYYLAKRPKPAALKASKKDGLRGLFEHDSAEAKYAWDVMSHTLAYAADLVGEIADNIELIDRAMCLGFNWKKGPFKLIDEMGAAWFAERLQAEGRDVPEILMKVGGGKLYKTEAGQLKYFDLSGKYKLVERPAGVILLQDIKRKSSPVLKNISASVWDIGDGVLCLEFTSKMNSLDPFIMAMMRKTVKLIEGDKKWKGLVIHNEGTNFSVGANIAMLKYFAAAKQFWAILWVLFDGQGTMSKLKYSKFPVVAAPSGMALGGGCETLLHSNFVEAHAETYTGLVEVGVGIIPGWGGCKEMLGRAMRSPKTPKGPMPPVAHAFEKIGTAYVAKSAAEAIEALYFEADKTNVVMNRDRLLANAKKRVLDMAKNYTPPAPYEMKLPGPTGATALILAVEEFARQGVATPHDVTISKHLAYTLSGGDTDMNTVLTEADVLKLERESFIRLAKTKESLARVSYMLTKGKPLRN